MRFLFVGEFEYNCGSTHAVYSFKEQAEALGHQLFLQGAKDEIVSRLFDTIPLHKADFVIFVIEDQLYVDEKYLEHIKEQIPKSKRAVIDVDGKYNPLVTLDHDYNHPDEKSQNHWKKIVEDLSDKILIPTLRKPESGRQFLFFGYEPPIDHSIPKSYDVLYVGNNWYRWGQIAELLKIIAPIRKEIGRIGLMGKWWDGHPLPGRESVTSSDTDFLKTRNVEVHPSVPFRTIIETMSQGRINPMLVRPVLDHMEMVTPRMFETLAADTIPLFLPSHFRYAEKLYGADSFSFRLSNRNPSDSILEMLRDQQKYKEALTKIRSRLAEDHGYEKRFNELLNILVE